MSGNSGQSCGSLLSRRRSLGQALGSGRIAFHGFEDRQLSVGELTWRQRP
ncbi:hypothetical protein [Streptomyces zagrosensis]|uniref:Uncharacterized protein n=1 Tax=Streptomyces zagrosensis TaxID=1042984 RepID=A0A7W9V108_9ACTN|nr:hypothetical protein [Streptomyces zagrosensis]MBB5938432.1 hypothetical protein [Streptomyces zagrosensis]